MEHRDGGLRHGAGQRSHRFRRDVDWKARMAQKDVKRLMIIRRINVDITKRRSSLPICRGGRRVRWEFVTLTVTPVHPPYQITIPLTGRFRAEFRMWYFD